MSNCGCHQCLQDRDERVEFCPGFSVPAGATRMVLCPTCGNKRCPHATDHRHACTVSNEPDQPGSLYGGYKLLPSLPDPTLISQLIETGRAEVER